MAMIIALYLWMIKQTIALAEVYLAEVWKSEDSFFLTEYTVDSKNIVVITSPGHKSSRIKSLCILNRSIEIYNNIKRPRGILRAAGTIQK